MNDSLLYAHIATKPYTYYFALLFLGIVFNKHVLLGAHA